MPRLSALTSDKQLSVLFADETEKASQVRMFKLVSFTVPNQEEPVCLVDSNYNVTFDGVEYTAFPLKVAAAQINTDGSIDKTSITVANVSREMMNYVETYNGLRSQRVKIKSVYENVLDFVYFPQPDGTVVTADNTAKNNTAYIEEEYFIDTYTATEQVVIFQLEPIIDLNIRIPRRRYMVDTCYWKYKDMTTCKHSGSTTILVSTTAGSPNIVITAPDGISASARKITTGTKIHIGTDPVEYTVASSVSTTGADGKVTSWACTISPTPITSTTGYLFFVTCSKSLSDCAVRSNIVNFGGFPGVSGSRRVIL